LAVWYARWLCFHLSGIMLHHKMARQSAIILLIQADVTKWVFLRSETDMKMQDSIVDIATGYRLDDWGVGVWVLVGPRIFSSPCHPDQLWGPPNLLSNGYWGALSPGVKRPGREADHSPSASAKVKKMWIYATTTPICLHGIVLI
jgi:hypothetical protein